MKHLAILMLFMGTLALIHADDEKDKYTTRYDDINIDDIINSPRILKNYVNCILDQGACTAEGTELKKHIADAMQTDCSKCSEKQKTSTDKVLHHLMNNEPEYWKQLQAKYDPSGSYTRKYMESKKA